MKLEKTIHYFLAHCFLANWLKKAKNCCITLFEYRNTRIPLIAIKTATLPLLVFITVALTACADDSNGGPEPSTLALLHNDNSANIAQSVIQVSDIMLFAISASELLEDDNESNFSNKMIQCSSLDPNGQGSATVSGIKDSETQGSDFTFRFNNCMLSDHTINGSMQLMLSNSESNDSFSATADVAISTNNSSWRIDNFSLVYTHIKNNNNYAMNYSMDIGFPDNSYIEAVTTTSFAGNTLNIPENAETGVLTLSGGNGSNATLTVINNQSGYYLNLDADGDSINEVQIMNPVDNSLIFPWP